MVVEKETQHHEVDKKVLDDIIAKSDLGSRNPKGFNKIVVIGVAFLWALFQIYYASPLPFYFSELFGTNLTLVDQQARSIHLGFAIFLAYMLFPAYMHKISFGRRFVGWILLLSGIGACYYGIQEYKNNIPQDIREGALTYTPYITLLAMLLANPLLQKVLGFRSNLLSIVMIILAGVCGYMAYTDYTTLLAGIEENKTYFTAMYVFTAGMAMLLLAVSSFAEVSRTKIQIPEWIIALMAAFSATYLFWFYRDISTRPALPTHMDIITVMFGVAFLLEATRRALGPPLMMVSLLFIAYALLGPIMPDVIAHKGVSLTKFSSHQWLTTEGVFGVAIGVSTKFVFLFVLFGALLERAGAGTYFIKVAFSLLGHMRGGPAKAAVVASGLSGMISGSSIANVVTMGTFTIPLMKKVGFKGEKAGAVEAAAGIDGQIMPPVMGAAAFLMVEYVGIPYTAVIKHAFLPAILSYIALFYIVHLEALKVGMVSLKREHHDPSPLFYKLLRLGLNISGFLILCGIVYFGILGLRAAFPGLTTPIVLVGLLLAYLGLLYFVSMVVKPDTSEDLETVLATIPKFKDTFQSGLHFLLPVFVLIWCLMVDHLNPGLAAFWATLMIMFTVTTQKAFVSLFQKDGLFFSQLKQGVVELFTGMIAGSRNMVGIGIATAAAGIIVGTVSQTGLGLVMTEFVEYVAGDNLALMLAFTALISLVLGMGIPTTANYIVVSTLMAPVIVALGAKSGLVVPLIAVHMFVFYFGIMADVTPPVGLAAYAAAAIAGSDPMKTGLTAALYSLRTAAIPFCFIFNTEILLIGVSGFSHVVVVIVISTIGILTFAAATQGYFLTRNKWFETVLLLLITFTFFRPDFWLDRIESPFSKMSADQIIQYAATQTDEGRIRFVVEGENIRGDLIKKTVLLPLGPAAENGVARSGEERLAYAGLSIAREQDKIIIDQVAFGSQAEKRKLNYGWEIKYIEHPKERMDRKWIYLPGLVLLGIVMLMQRRRQKQVIAV